ncbi:MULTISPECIES: chromate transporter [Megasphaera]|uniref:Chromate transport protein n=1 Tax=Megasphaera vaginalis (ex Srinivasan et al. 2021) TaxID=1111454 RepID=U7UJX0_9FIRM|nr:MULTISPECIES: chromate transporter [Megasphaera]ERT59169.1 chromate transport protein [Megasphaera vaginalis (ex Srinivasan et al. 2021)]
MTDRAERKVTKDFYWKLFTSTFIISAVTVGGGYVIIPLLKAKYVDEYGWITDKEALELVAVGQSMPGVVAVNSAVILGYRMAGIAGTLTALTATVLPPLAIIMAVSFFYDYFIQNIYIKFALRGMQCGATALIVNVGLDLLIKQGRKRLALPLAIIGGTFIGTVFFDLNIMYLILLDALIGLLFMKREKYD